MPGDRDSRAFLDPALAARLSRLDLIARLVVEGFLTGLHKSPYHGFSVEFAEHRPYNEGDDIRFVDWKLFGKTDRYYIKQYEEETNLRAHLILDASGSMGYQKQGTITKLRYAALLAASLAYLMQGQQDAVGLLIFDERIRRLLPAHSTRVHFRRILTELENAEPSGHDTRIGPALHTMAERIRRRGLVLLVSDLWNEREEDVLQGLRHFRHQRHEVVLFHVLDPAEEEFPFREETEFQDLESGRRVFTNPWEIRGEYMKLLRERTSTYRVACGQMGVEYVPVSTATPFDLALFRYLEKRSRLH